MEGYVRQHSAGTIVRSSFEIYRRYFGVLLLSTLIPFVPFLILQLLGVIEQNSVAGVVLLFLPSLLNIVPTTVLISDICVGNEPALGRAYRRAFGKLTGKVLLTILLVFGLIVLGFVLLIVPGIVAGCWLTFAAVVAVLERTSAPAALGRSRQLGKGHYLRNAGTYVVTGLIAYVPAFILSAIIGAVGGLADAPRKVIELAGSLLGVLAAAPPAIAVVLLYYDMRVRKEAYDSTKLAEDLRH